MQIQRSWEAIQLRWISIQRRWKAGWDLYQGEGELERVDARGTRRHEGDARRAVVATLLHVATAGYPSRARAPSRSSAYPWRPRAPSCAARRVRSKQAPPAWPRTHTLAGCPRRPVPTRSSSAASSTTRAWRITCARQALRTARVRRSASSCTAALARRRVGSLRADIRGDFAVASTHAARTGEMKRAGRAA